MTIGPRRRYVLPAGILSPDHGGGEIEAQESDNGPDGASYWLGAFSLRAPYRLEPVLPPLPPEPEVGEFVACGGDGNLLPFFRRWSEGWSVVSRDPQFSDVTAWAGVVAISRERANRDPVRLVPVPEPVSLPWLSPGDVVAVRPLRGAVSVDAEDGHVQCKPDLAREWAAALLSAADEAERGQ